eukprot:1761003-Prymnesium_polylepis.1
MSSLRGYSPSRLPSQGRRFVSSDQLRCAFFFTDNSQAIKTFRDDVTGKHSKVFAQTFCEDMYRTVRMLGNHGVSSYGLWPMMRHVAVAGATRAL